MNNTSQLILHLTNKINVIIKTLNKSLSIQVFFLILHLQIFSIYIVYVFGYKLGGGKLAEKIELNSGYIMEIILNHYSILQITWSGHLLHEKVVDNF